MFVDKRKPQSNDAKKLHELADLVCQVAREDVEDYVRQSDKLNDRRLPRARASVQDLRVLPARRQASRQVCQSVPD